MKNLFSSSLLRIVAFSFWIVVFSGLLATETRARSNSSETGLRKPTIVLLLANGQGSRITPEAKARLLAIAARYARLNPEALKAAKRCGCQPDFQGGITVSYGACLKACLADVGISPYSMIMCGAACGIGAVPICAICLGVSIAVVELCALGCAAYPNGMGGGGKGIILTHHAMPGRGISTPLRAKLKLRPARATS